MDVTAAVAVIALITVAATTLGSAKLIPAATSVGFKWAKAMIFG
jgi:hypothetical protein